MFEGALAENAGFVVVPAGELAVGSHHEPDSVFSGPAAMDGLGQAVAGDLHETGFGVVLLRVVMAQAFHPGLVCREMCSATFWAALRQAF